MDYINPFRLAQYVRALAMCAGNTTDKSLREELLSLAEKCWNIRQRIPELYPPQKQETWHHQQGRLRCAATWVEAAAEMYGVTGEEKYLDLAVEKADFVLSLQQKEPVIKGSFYGYFYYHKEKSGKEVYNGQRRGAKIDKDLPGVALATLIGVAPEHPDADKWKESLRLYAEGTLKPLARVNSPYGYIASGPYMETYVEYPVKCTVKDMEVHRFSYQVKNFKRRGKVIMTALLALADFQIQFSSQYAAIGKVLKDRELIKMAENNIRYFFGSNPFHLSYMREFGDKCVEQATIPNIPGFFMSAAPAMTEDGEPFYLAYGDCRRMKPPVYIVREGTTIALANLLEAISYVQDAGI